MGQAAEHMAAGNAPAWYSASGGTGRMKGTNRENWRMAVMSTLRGGNMISLEKAKLLKEKLEWNPDIGDLYWGEECNSDMVYPTLQRTAQQS